MNQRKTQLAQFADELKQGLQEAIGFASGKTDKSKYLVYIPADKGKANI